MGSILKTVHSIATAQIPHPKTHSFW